MKKKNQPMANIKKEGNWDLVSVKGEVSDVKSERSNKCCLFINTQQENALLRTRVCLLDKHKKYLLIVGQ